MNEMLIFTSWNAFGTNIINITPILVLFHIDPCLSNVYNLGCYFNLIHIWTQFTFEWLNHAQLFFCH